MVMRFLRKVFNKELNGVVFGSNKEYSVNFSKTKNKWFTSGPVNLYVGKEHDFVFFTDPENQKRGRQATGSFFEVIEPNIDTGDISNIEFGCKLVLENMIKKDQNNDDEIEDVKLPKKVKDTNFLSFKGSYVQKKEVGLDLFNYFFFVPNGSNGLIIIDVSISNEPSEDIIEDLNIISRSFKSKNSIKI
jgi:hypothetical protein